jgi:hypothetical protein
MPGAGGVPIHETIVNWCERMAPPTQCYGGEREKQQGKAWVELYVTWSPQGTYLASLHIPGIALWGGEHFEKQGRFAHSKVKVIEFSPCEVSPTLVLYETVLSFAIHYKMQYLALSD